jgi:hypothetical protein
MSELEERSMDSKLVEGLRDKDCYSEIIEDSNMKIVEINDFCLNTILWYIR